MNNVSCAECIEMGPFPDRQTIFLKLFLYLKVQQFLFVITYYQHDPV